jgi:tetratricopeptide (TPR) repeat protein
MMKIFNRIWTLLPGVKPLFFVKEHPDSFEKESEDGWNLFPDAGLHLFRIKMMLKLLVFRNIWGRLSIPVKVCAVVCCIATASGAVYVTQVISNMPGETAEKKEQSQSAEIHILQEFQHQTEAASSEAPATEIESTGLRVPETTGQIQMIRPIQYQSLTIYPDNEHVVRYSSFREFSIHNFRFVDFRPLYAPEKPLLIPVLSGMEARFENRESKKQHEPFLMADTISYLKFLEKLAAYLDVSEYNEAERLVSLLAGQRPEDENALYYKGYIHFSKKEYNVAFSYFLKCEHSTFRAFYHEAKLHRAYILFLTGKPDDALAVVSAIEQENGIYLKQALMLKSKILKNELP